MLEFLGVHDGILKSIIVLGFGTVLASLIFLTSKSFLASLHDSQKTRIVKILIREVRAPVLFIVFIYTIFFALKPLPIGEQAMKLIEIGSFSFTILSIAFVLSIFSRHFINEWMRSQRSFRKTPKIIQKIITATIFLIAILIILLNYNIEITPIIATLGIGGLAIGLALQGTLSNFFAGLNVLSDKPIRVGDYVEIESNNGVVSGTVEDIGWRSTKVRTLLQTFIVVPNSRLEQSIITNYSMPDEAILIPVECGVDYGSDLEHVENISLEVAEEIQKNIPGAVKEKIDYAGPIFRYYEYGESNIKFRIFLLVEDYVSQFRVRSEFVKRLKKRFDEENIEISWPVRKLYDKTVPAPKLARN